MKVCHYDPFFYPLDSIQAWNRIYGKRGFYQYQCVVPTDDYAAIKELLSVISSSGAGSFLAVLKEFGDTPSLGMLSFPRPGVTMALDFPNNRAATRTLLDRLDEVVMAVGGAVYPAKDARLSGPAFKAYYPRWQEFVGFIDPKFSSSFWRLVSGIPKSQQTSRIRGDISTQAGSRMTLIRSSLVGLLRSMVFHPETPNKMRTHPIYRMYC